MDFNKALQLIYGKLVRWLYEFIRLLPNIALAALVVVVGFFIARWLKRTTSRLSHKFSHNSTLTDLISSFIHIFAIGVTLFISAEHFAS